IHANGEIYRGSWFGSRWLSSKAEDAAARYEKDVIDLLDQTFRQRGTSIRLLWEIKQRSPKHVYISPFTVADGEEFGLGNAITLPTDDRDAAPQGGAPYLGRDDDCETDHDERYDLAPYQGTGKGSHARIHFTPALYRAAPGSGDAPNETLPHELVHCLRIL